MAKQLDAWIHNFTVTDCETHKKGYTVYKITSIIFPVFVPESLTCLTVWKRYNDVKKLRKQIVLRHRELRLGNNSTSASAAVPPLDDDGYFRRFDADVLLARKQHILRLLDFIAQQPALYKCHAFVQFFESSQLQHSPQTTTAPLTPLKQHNGAAAERRNSAIASICDELAESTSIRLLGADEYNLIDPQRDEPPLDAMSQSMASLSTCASSDATSASACSEAGETDVGVVGATQPDAGGVDEVDCAVEAFADGCTTGADDDYEDDDPIEPADMHPTTSASSTTADYIFEAALEFSDAVRAEVARDQRAAFELYKSGIGRLINGVRRDACAERRRIAKDKIAKYMLRAEQIYACHLASGGPTTPRPVRTGTSLQPTTAVTDETGVDLRDCDRRHPGDRLLSFDELAHIKVLRLVRGTSIMLVQDTRSASAAACAMKAVEKPANFAVQLFELLPARPVPGMVQLRGFFVSETMVYLMLEQATGGRLFDYMRTHHRELLRAEQTRLQTGGGVLNSLFQEPARPVGDAATSADGDTDVDDDAFLGALKRLRSPSAPAATADDASDTTPPSDDEVPAFDELTAAMDVSDLVSCSQKLLALVDSTIERSNADAAAAEANDDDEEAGVETVDDVHGSTQTLTQPMAESIRRPDRIAPIDRPLPSPPTSSHLDVVVAAIPMRTIRRWASELCTALDDLHANGIVCGDLHAGNLLLGSGGRLLLSYFYPRGTHESSTHEPRLAPHAVRDLYVAPERPLTRRSDWWSFGVLLWELVTGERFGRWHAGGMAAYAELQWPDCGGREATAEARDLIGGLVRADAERRLDARAVRQHGFFRDTVWDAAAEDEAEV